MVTVIGIWEPGFTDEQTFIEWRMWKQTILAFGVDRWCMVGSQRPGGGFEPFETLTQALETAQGKRVFLIPDSDALPVHDIMRGMYLHPKDNVFIFGNVDEDLRSFVRPDVGPFHEKDDDLAVNIPTTNQVDMFAAACLPLVLYR